MVKMLANVVQTVEVSVRRVWVKITMVAVVVAVSFFLTMPFAYNMKELKRSHDDYAPLVVADIIAEYNATVVEPATLFCYQMSDCGFYNAASLIPNVYYYARNSFIEKDFPVMYEAFRETIRTQKCDFIVTYLNAFKEHETELMTYYDFYFGTLEASTLPIVGFEQSGYLESQIVILFRRG